MQRRSLFGLSSLLVALVVSVILVAGETDASDPTRPLGARVAQARPDIEPRSGPASDGMDAPAQQAAITATKYLPIVYGPPAVEIDTLAPYDGARFDSGGETWEAAKAGSDLYLSGPYGSRVLAKEQAPDGSLVIYAFSRSILYFDTSSVADPSDGRVAGDLTLTYYNETSRQPLDLSVGLLFRRTPAPPPAKEMWSQFDDWPLLASRPITSTINVTQTVTLDAGSIVEDDGTLPETVAIGVQTTEPYLEYGQSIYSRFHLGRMTLMIPTISEERSRE